MPSILKQDRQALRPGISKKDDHHESMACTLHRCSCISWILGWLSSSKQLS